MGGVFSGVAVTWPSQAIVDQSDGLLLPQLPDSCCPVSAPGIVEKQTLELYLHACVKALGEQHLTDKPVCWTLPPSLRLVDGSAATTATTACEELLLECCARLGARLQCLSFAGHEEVNSAVIRALHWKGKSLAPLWLRSGKCRRTFAALRVVDLSDCPLGDDGVRELMELLFPSPATRKRQMAVLSKTSACRTGVSLPENSHGNSDLMEEQQNAPCLLSSLRSLHLNGVGISDTGVDFLCDKLEASQRLYGTSTPLRQGLSYSNGALLPQLSLQRNRLSYRGISRVLRASLVTVACDSADFPASAAAPLISAVDTSWNSFAADTSSRSEEAKDLLRAIGTAFVGAATNDAKCSLDVSGSASVCLRGCELHADEMRALCIDGALLTYIDRFREAGRAEILRSSATAATLEIPVPLTSISSVAGNYITRLDFSENPHLGDNGVLCLLSTIVSLESTRQSTADAHHPVGLVPHALTFLEELLLRNVGCTDAVLSNVVSLLLGDEHDGTALMTHMEAAKDTHLIASGLSAALDDNAPLLDALRTEVRALCDMRAQNAGAAVTGASLKPPPSATSASNKRVPGVLLPRLQLLDLSFNVFTSPKMIAAVIASAVVRTPFAHAVEHDGVAEPVAATTERAIQGEDGEYAFAVALESCRVTDAALRAVPSALEFLHKTCAAMPSALMETGKDKTTAASPSDSICALFLGGNELTHNPTVHLRHHLQQQCRSANSAGQADMGHLPSCVVGFVEGNAVVHPSISSSTACFPAEVADDGSGNSAHHMHLTETARETGLQVAPSGEAARRRRAAFFTGDGLRVSWNTLPTLPDGAGSMPTARRLYSPSAANAPRASPSQRSQAAEVATRARPADREAGGEKVRTAGANRQLRAPDGVASLTPLLDGEEYIDEFIAEAERVMQERALYVKRAETAGMLSPESPVRFTV